MAPYQHLLTRGELRSILRMGVKREQDVVPFIAINADVIRPCEDDPFGREYARYVRHDLHVFVEVDLVRLHAVHLVFKCDQVRRVSWQLLILDGVSPERLQVRSAGEYRDDNYDDEQSTADQGCTYDPPLGPEN